MNENSVKWDHFRQTKITRLGEEGERWLKGLVINETFETVSIDWPI
jgi:hypothetical protein